MSKYPGFQLYGSRAAWPGHHHKKEGNLVQARKFTIPAPYIDTRNQVALDNMGVVLGLEGRASRSVDRVLPRLRRVLVGTGYFIPIYQ